MDKRESEVCRYVYNLFQRKKYFLLFFVFLEDFFLSLKNIYLYYPDYPIPDYKPFLSLKKTFLHNFSCLKYFFTAQGHHRRAR